MFSIKKFLNLDDFANLRRYTDICFLFKLVNGLISCLELLQFIYLNINHVFV